MIAIISYLCTWPKDDANGSNMALGFGSVLVSAERQLVWAYQEGSMI